VAVLALAVAVLNAHDGLGVGERVLRSEKIAQRQSEVRRGSEPASGQHPKASGSLPDPRVEREVVEDSLSFVVGAARERRLEFSRQRDVQGMEEKVVVESEGIGQHVERLVHAGAGAR
jgi:hypothetical protein